MTSKLVLPTAGLLTLLTMTACGGEAPASESPPQTDTSTTSALEAASDKSDAKKLADLGSKLYFDTNLSNPAGQACASCHLPSSGYSDPDQQFATSQGAISWRFGNRNAPTALYAQFTPPFQFNPLRGHPYIGGQFGDGRAATLEDQAKAPFLNPLEMNNADAASVVSKIRAASYAKDFLKVFGATSLDNPDQAFASATQAIAAFERTPTFAPFTSKYDAFLAGKAKLTAQEQQGMDLFNDADKTNCGDCHASVGLAGNPPLFTDFTYANIGVPKNPLNPFYLMPAPYNPAGFGYVDLGLGGVLGLESENGKFRVPTLRNVALTAPYMHNGYFKDLRSVVVFYSTRDVASAHWPAPEVGENIDGTIGDLQLTDKEIDAIVAFLNTLTDGYTH